LLRLTLQERRGISDVEMVITGPDSELLPVAMSTSSLVTPDNQIIGAMVLIFNLTEIKRLESTVQRADRLTSIGTMAAGMAHEIKNPLVSIKTFSQLLLDRYDDEDFRKTFAEVVPPEVQRIDSIVSRLLDFARPKPVVFAPLYLRDVISDVLALVENQMRKANVEVFVEFPQEERTVTADEQLLHQLFLNLILNALDAMRDSRDKRLSIKLQFTHSHLQREQPASLLDVPCAKIYISDTGCGIAEKNISQLFTPFYTTKEHGSGLGLSVVHGIVTQHKGDITVTSALGVGTTFILTFPLTPQSEPEIAVNRKETIGAGGPKT
jgi:two-component system nitrogen regulation sensor histidine kinase GlnL